MLELTEQERELLEVVVQYYLHLDWQIKQRIREHLPPLDELDVAVLRMLYTEKLEKDN